MTALRRTVRINGGPMRPLDLNVMCDQCNKSRAHGNHTKCSKLRQAEAIERRVRENMSNQIKHRKLGNEPLVGMYYVSECIKCGWNG